MFNLTAKFHKHTKFHNKTQSKKNEIKERVKNAGLPPRKCLFNVMSLTINALKLGWCFWCAVSYNILPRYYGFLIKIKKIINSLHLIIPHFLKTREIKTLLMKANIHYLSKIWKIVSNIL